MELFQRMAGLGYGELHACRDEKTGLRGLVGLYSTRLGPAIGGTRVRAYATEGDAIDDVLRLARAMAYKAALARLPHGGGKAVIWLDGPAPTGEARTALFRRFGQFVDGLGGRYVTTEDSGTSPADMDVVRQVTRHVVGASTGSGDPSPFTALGCRRGIEAVAHHVLGRPDLKGLHVAIQGVGHVGAYLAHELARLGATLTVSDVDGARAKAVAAETGAKLVDSGAILETECDVLAPCALGGPITDALVPKLRCKAIAGAANNQHASLTVGPALAARNIFYAPDYAINAGGLINVASEYAGYDKDAATAKTTAIYDTIRAIAERSAREKRIPGEIADRMAEEIIGTP